LDFAEDPNLQVAAELYNAKPSMEEVSVVRYAVVDAHYSQKAFQVPSRTSARRMKRL
jgi:hypothetical protein